MHKSIFSGGSANLFVDELPFPTGPPKMDALGWTCSNP
jgi:hypothetical protein